MNDELPIQYAEPEPGTQEDAREMCKAFAKWAAVIVGAPLCAWALVWLLSSWPVQFAWGAF